jgi:hypothetical protein
MIVNTRQDMRTISTGFHVIELHSKTVLWGSTVLMIALAVAAGAYLMWRRARRRSVVREEARRMARMEQHLRMELGAVTASPGKRMARVELRDEGPGWMGDSGLPRLMMPQALPPTARVEASHRRSSSGYVPRA